MHHHAHAAGGLQGPQNPNAVRRSASHMPLTTASKRLPLSFSLGHTQRVFVAFFLLCGLCGFAVWSGQRAGTAWVVVRNGTLDSVTEHQRKVKDLQMRQYKQYLRRVELQAKLADSKSPDFGKKQIMGAVEWDGSPEHDPYINWQAGFTWRKVSATRPRVYYVHELLRGDEAEQLINLAKPALSRSTVVGGKNGEVSQHRTSEGMFLVSHEQSNHPVTRTLRARASAFTGIPEVNFEPIQILRYHPGQRYLPHHDFFDQNGENMMKVGGQRVMTMLCWLNDVASAGDTGFPRANVTIPPKKNDAIFWYDVDETGKVDPMSEHTGLPPGEGSDKWVAIIWMRERKFY